MSEAMLVKTGLRKRRVAPRGACNLCAALAVFDHNVSCEIKQKSESQISRLHRPLWKSSRAVYQARYTLQQAVVLKKKMMGMDGARDNSVRCGEVFGALKDVHALREIPLPVLSVIAGYAGCCDLAAEPSRDEDVTALDAMVSAALVVFSNTMKEYRGERSECACGQEDIAPDAELDRAMYEAHLQIHEDKRTGWDGVIQPTVPLTKRTMHRLIRYFKDEWPRVRTAGDCDKMVGRVETIILADMPAKGCVVL